MKDLHAPWTWKTRHGFPSLQDNDGREILSCRAKPCEGDKAILAATPAMLSLLRKCIDEQYTFSTVSLGTVMEIGRLLEAIDNTPKTAQQGDPRP